MSNDETRHARLRCLILLAVQSTWAGPLDRVRGTKCDVNGCQAASITEAQQAKAAIRKEAQEKQLAERYPPPKTPEPRPAPQPSHVLKFDKTDPLYQLLMKTLIEESEARKAQLAQEHGEPDQ